MCSKLWGEKEFWGIGSEFDPDWCFNDEEKDLRDKVIELCRRKIRPLAANCDATYEFPKESLDAMAKLGLMGLIIPKKFGGLGQSHTCLAMVLETLARYGCPSTAMIYSMHSEITATILQHHHDNKEIQTLLRRICREGLIGSSAHSDSATGGHFWFPLSSKCRKVDEDHFMIYRFNSWTTSAGFADFYVFQTPSPDDEKDFSKLTTFFVFKEEIRASSDDWSALGLHGNQSGPLIFEGILPKSRLIGKVGEGEKLNNEATAPFFYICTTAVWNGIALGCIDLAKKHSMQKTHGDTGMRVADYATIQDYVGGCICETNACRSLILLITAELDRTTNRNDWSLYKNLDFSPRSSYLLWLMQAKLNASENVSKVADKMLKACGGDGYKTNLGLERLLRDAKAGCVMAPTNEVVRNIIGKGSLHGLESLDLYNKTYNRKLLFNELNKMTLEEKEEFLETLTKDIETQKETLNPDKAYQDTDFDNPFNVSPPKFREVFKTQDGFEHKAALRPNSWTPLKLQSKCKQNSTMMSFVFAFPSPSDHSGCLPGQFIQMKVLSEGKEHTRFFSPVSSPNHFGSIELILKLETSGIVSNILQKLKPGELVEFLGPCGGFEYQPNMFNELMILASGSGVTPAIQLIRSLASDQEDKTKLKLIYFSNDVEEILCLDELMKISSADSRLNVIITLSEPPEDWKGEEGFIDQKMINKYMRLPDSGQYRVILCGGPTMTISCLHSLRDLNFPSNKIFIYGQFGVQQIRAVYGRNAKLGSHNC